MATSRWQRDHDLGPTAGDAGSRPDRDDPNRGYRQELTRCA